MNIAEQASQILFPNQVKLFIVRLYDGFDNEWIDISEPVLKAEAQQIWNEKTNNGEKNTKFEDYYYYAIFPADTKMMFSSGIPYS